MFLGENLFYAFLLASGVTGSSWHSFAYGSITPVFASTIMWPSVSFLSLTSSYEDIAHIALRAYLTLVWPCLNWLYLQGLCFQIRNHSTVLGRTWLLGGYCPTQYIGLLWVPRVPLIPWSCERAQSKRGSHQLLLLIRKIFMWKQGQFQRYCLLLFQTSPLCGSHLPSNRLVLFYSYTVYPKLHLYSSFCTPALWRITALQSREKIPSSIPLHSSHSHGHTCWSLLLTLLTGPFSEGSHISESCLQRSL